VDKLLGHGRGRIKEIYDRYNYEEETSQWLEKWTIHLLYKKMAKKAQERFDAETADRAWDIEKVT
jgi:hypothetical protein